MTCQALGETHGGCITRAVPLSMLGRGEATALEGGGVPGILRRWLTLIYADLGRPRPGHRMTLIRRELPRSTSVRLGRSHEHKGRGEDSPDRCRMDAAVSLRHRPTEPQWLGSCGLRRLALSRAQALVGVDGPGNCPDEAEQFPRHRHDGLLFRLACHQMPVATVEPALGPLGDRQDLCRLALLPRL